MKEPRDDEHLIPRHGGYEHTKTWQLADLLYDITVRFCDKYVDPRSRTHDQMVRAARSGSHNLEEGSIDSAVCAANGALSLLNLCIYLTKRQLDAQTDAFEQEGGFTERLYRIRSQRRNPSRPPNTTE